MNASIRSYRIVLLRTFLFCADTIMILLLLATFLTAFIIGTGVRPPPLMWLMMENYGSFPYIGLPLGAAWLYSRVRARRFDASRLLVLRSDLLDSWALSRIPIALAVFGALVTGITGSVLAALGFFGGMMVASGAGAALKARMIGLVHERTQLPFAFISALAILGASWLASWAHFSIVGFAIHGGYWAPALGILAGMFMDLGDKKAQTAASPA
jgi:hypothetical protein